MIYNLPRVLCPKCGQFGFLSGRWVSSTYYPKYCSVKHILLEGAEKKLANDPLSEWYRERVAYFNKIVRGSIYRGRSRKHLSQYNEAEDDTTDKKSLKRVTYGKYFCFYVGHYYQEKYREQMDKYHQGVIKSRPNGRRWCKPSRYFYRYLIVDDPSGRYIKFIRSAYPRRAKKIYS
jgi:hypothetical protein